MHIIYTTEANQRKERKESTRYNETTDVRRVSHRRKHCKCTMYVMSRNGSRRFNNNDDVEGEIMQYGSNEESAGSDLRGNES